MTLHPILNGIFKQVFHLKINNKTLILTVIETHGKQYIWNQINKERVHKFHIGYMIHRNQKIHRNHREQVIIFLNRHSN